MDGGRQMDRRSAKDALRAADAASAAARSRTSGGLVVYLLLGLAEMLVIGILGGPLVPGIDTSIVIVMVLALTPIFAAVGYSASRSATPRHSRVVSAALLALASGVLSVTLTVGSVFFPESKFWWAGGALLSGLAIAFCGVPDLRYRPARGGPPQ